MKPAPTDTATNPVKECDFEVVETGGRILGCTLPMGHLGDHLFNNFIGFYKNKGSLTGAYALKEDNEKRKTEV